MIISSKEVEDIMKIVKSLEHFGLMTKGASKTIENEAKEQKCGFFGIIFGTLAASLLGNLFAAKGVHAGDGVIKAGKGTIRARQDF